MFNNSNSILPWQSSQQINTGVSQNVAFSPDTENMCKRFKADLLYIPFDILKQGNNTKERLRWWERTVGNHNVEERLNKVFQYNSPADCKLTDNEQDRLRFVNKVGTFSYNNKTNFATQQEVSRISNDMAAFRGSTASVTLASVIKVCCGFVAATLPLFLSADANNYFNR